MAQSFFIWNGKDSRSMGIIKRGPSSIIRPEERVKHLEIPGRSGDLTQTEGTDEELIYNSYIQTASISVKGGFRVRDVFKWLQGSGYVTFDCEPDRRQKARIIGAITLDKVSRNIDHWAGEVQFYCQPLKELMSDDPVTLTTIGGTVYNRGDVNSKPRIKATFSGGGYITINGATILASSVAGGTMVFDCDAGIITNEAGTVEYESTGTFPILKPGANVVSGYRWTQLVIERRERFL